MKAREACGSTPAQFSQAVSSLLGNDTPLNQQLLLAMEAGFALVPAHMLAAAEQLHADHQAELERQQAAAPPAVLVGGEYPYQEPMEGADYQIAPPRYLGGVGGTKALSRDARKDELIYQPKMALPELEWYLLQAKSMVGRTNGQLTYSEEVALSVLHDLSYDADAALAALQHCLSWLQPKPVGDQLSEPPVRAAAANSVLWVQRLRDHACRNTWSTGEKEALDAGIAKYGKELAVMHRAQDVLREKTLPQLIEMYYVAGWRHQSP